MVYSPAGQGEAAYTATPFPSWKQIFDAFPFQDSLSYFSNKFLLAFCSRCFFFVFPDPGAGLPSSCEAFLLLTSFTVAGMIIPVLMLMIMMMIRMMLIIMMMIIYDDDDVTSSPCLHPWLTQRGSAGLLVFVLVFVLADLCSCSSTFLNFQWVFNFVSEDGNLILYSILLPRGDYL